MRALLILTLSSLLAGGAMAQRGGGGHGGGGGFRGGGGGGFHGGGGGFVGNFGHGGFVGNFGFRGGIGFRGFGFGGYYPYYGYGLGYWPGYYDYGYGYPYDYSGGYSYPAYQSSPNVTVVYPSQAQPAYYSQPARPVSHTYDEYGQEVNSSAANYPAPPANSASASPIYLIAMKDGVIRAAASYWVNGQTLHYVTMEHQEKEAPLGEIDRSLSQLLNRERRVQFQLPQ